MRFCLLVIHEKFITSHDMMVEGGSEALVQTPSDAAPNASYEAFVDRSAIDIVRSNAS